MTYFLAGGGDVDVQVVGVEDEQALAGVVELAADVQVGADHGQRRLARLGRGGTRHQRLPREHRQDVRCRIPERKTLF